MQCVLLCLDRKKTVCYVGLLTQYKLFQPIPRRKKIIPTSVTKHSRYKPSISITEHLEFNMHVKYETTSFLIFFFFSV
jgi:hypothetical protein